MKLNNREMMQVEGLDDGVLLNIYRKTGNMEMIGILYKRYSGQVLKVCKWVLNDVERAREALSEIFEKLIGLLSVHQPLNFRSWLRAVVRNHCMQIKRKESRLPEEVSIGTDFEVEDQAMNEIGREELNKQIVSALGELPAGQERCLCLFYFSGRSYKEIAEIEKMDLNSVKSHIQNGKRNLKNKLAGIIEANW